jgi:fructosamine-3-kinase
MKIYGFMAAMTEKIKAIFDKAGLDVRDHSPITDGHYNDSFFVDSSQGKFVLRIAPADDIPKLFYEVDMMKSEPGIHSIVRENTDIPVPAVVFHDFSRELIDRDYLIMEFLQGKKGFFRDKELGEYVKQLHRIEGGECGYPDRAAPTGGNWRELFYRYAELIFEDCLSCRIISEEEKDYFLSVYDRYKDIIPADSRSLLHLDLWTQNILTENGKISGILDFDRGLYGDPELEFAVLDTYGYSSPEFFEGYGYSRPDDISARIRRRLYIVYELIKYAFIRYARNRSRAVGRSNVETCRQIISEIE